MKLHLHVKTEYFLAIQDGYKPGPENRIEFPWRRWVTRTITHKHFGPEPVDVFAIILEKP
jgi:hypothetical protein